MATPDFYDKPFIGSTLGTDISRGELESLPCPFDTENVSDGVMQSVIDGTELDTLADVINADEEFDFEKHSGLWWENLETNCRKHGIPYYED